MFDDCHCEGRILVAGAAVLLLATAGPAGPVPPWTEPDCAQRLVCTPGDDVGGSFLVTVPWRADAGVLSVLARDQRGGPVGARVVFQDAAAATVLVCNPIDPPGRNLNSNSLYLLYYGTGLLPDPPPELPVGAWDAELATNVTSSAPALPVALPVPIVDPKPVFSEFVGVPGSSVPNAWDRLLYMFGNGRESARGGHLPRMMPYDLQSLFPPEVDEHGGKRDRFHGTSIARMQTWVLCPEAGVYRFAVDAEHLAFLRVDGEPVTEAPFNSKPGVWHGGPPVALKAGPHRLDLFGFSARRVTLAVAWILPSAPAGAPFAEVPTTAYLSAAQADSRAETTDKVLHAAVRYELGRSYAFRGCPEIFVPVTLVNNSADWTGSPMIATWTAAGRHRVSAEQRATEIFLGAGLHPVTLHVRDTLGFTAQCDAIVDCRLVVPRHYAVDAELVDVPAACYPDDVIQPALRVVGELPAGLTLELAWRASRRSGEPSAGTQRIGPLGERAADVRLGRFTTGDLATLDWELRHETVILREGHIRCVRPPFAVAPASVRDAALLDADGNQLVYVPHRYAGQYSQAPLRQAQVFGAILNLDDVLTRQAQRYGERQTVFERTLEWIVDGPDHPSVTVVPLPADAASPDYYAPLAKFLRVPEYIAAQRDADIIVLSLALTDILCLRSPDVFERHAAALTDLVAAQFGKPMVWVTPPPYRPDAAAIRPYAAAVQRVADARRIPVADLYSALLGIPDSPFADDYGFELTVDAEALAAQLVARAMLSDSSQPKRRIRDLIRW